MAIKFFVMLLLGVMSVFQGILLYFFEDMLQAYLGMTIPGGDVDESFGFPLYVVLVFLASIVSAVIYWVFGDRINRLLKAAFVIVPYGLPLWLAEGVLSEMHDRDPVERLAGWYNQAVLVESSYLSLVFVGLLLLQQASIPYWVSKILQPRG